MSDLTINNKKGEFSKILRRGAIIGIVVAGAVITTPPLKNNDNKSALTASKHVENSTSINQSLSSSFEGVEVLGIVTIGTALGLFMLGRKLDKCYSE